MLLWSGRQFDPAAVEALIHVLPAA
jgi:hypothetical protein